MARYQYPSDITSPYGPIQGRSLFFLAFIMVPTVSLTLPMFSCPRLWCYHCASTAWVLTYAENWVASHHKNGTPTWVEEPSAYPWREPIRCLWLLLVKTLKGHNIFRHLQRSTVVQVSNVSNARLLLIHCLSWLSCPLKCARVFVSRQTPGPCLDSVPQETEEKQKNVRLPLSSCFSLIGIQVTHRSFLQSL